MDKDTVRLLCDISDDLCRAIVAAETDRIENVSGILAGINDRIIEALMPYGHADDAEPFVDLDDAARAEGGQEEEWCREQT